MKKLIFCFSLVCVGMLSSCVDKNELVDEKSKPSWLGESIYGELSNPDPSKGLTGTFKNYLRLVDDLGYAETLNRTGSKTVFPANDEAFERFFQSNDWGVSSYEDLTQAQKKMLLYSSMLDNAILVQMLSNVSSNDGIVSGNAVKHATSLNAIDTVTTYPFLSALDAYGERNPFWTRFSNGISLVSDATKPMLVHFTRDYMLKNSITTVGDGSDFSIITGGSYEDSNDAYVFGNRITSRDITCQNGYIHQVEDVVTPPGNMAQLIKRDKNLSIFNHMLDRFAMPVYNSQVTNNYHDWYAEQEKVQDMTGVPNPDSIYEVRYLSKMSQGNVKFNGDARSGGVFLDDNLLTFDPGWNGYYVASLTGSTATELADLGVMFVPDDEALSTYLTEGAGSILLTTYGKLPNTKENVMRNVEDVPLSILSKLISNMMNTSFAASVPSKFSSIVDDAKDVMGITIGDLKTKADGGYDVRIANNGVVYVMNKVFGPKAYEVVSAPALFGAETNMSMVNWIIQNVTYNNVYGLGLDYYAYLLSTSSNYGLFLPTNEAFDCYYLDPTSLTRSTGPEVIHYYYVGSGSSSSTAGSAGIAASRWKYNVETHQVGDSIGVIDFEGANNDANMPIIKAQLSDIIQQSTIVLGENETLQPGCYYLTKNGAGVKIEGSGDLSNGRVLGGGQLVDGLPAPTITEVFNQTNGKSYAIDHLIQGTTRSVYSYLSTTPRFSKFFDLCNGFDTEIMAWAGISTEKEEGGTGIIESDQYKTFFIPGETSTSSDQQLRCIDYNVKFFSNYNYTLYAPNNDAVDYAVNHGLPTWDAIYEIFSKYNNEEGTTPDGEEEAKAQVKVMIKAIRDFVRYHFHSNSVYATTTLGSTHNDYTTFLVDDNTHISQNLTVWGDNTGKIHVKDVVGEKVIDPSNTNLMTNEMTRDLEFNKNRTQAGNYVTASSYAVVHELTQPLSYNSTEDFSQGLQ